jgi:release factor glutamine methyltransferase
MRMAEVLTEATATLADAHLASPRVDAEILAAFVLGVRRGQLAGAMDLSLAQLDRFRTLVDERATRIPLQHLTGTAPFRHLELAVGPGVFVPRPETEVLVEWGLRWLRTTPGALAADHAIVVDLCSGSGAIAASIAVEAPGTRVYAVERDAAALRWLHRNTDGLAIDVVEGDATAAATLKDLDGTVDLVLCNPPYVPEIGASGLPPEVTEHDPRPAVFGGRDGLDVIRPLIGRVAALLRPGGAFGVEHDDTHAYVVPTLVQADGRFAEAELHHDLAQRPRFTTARRASGSPAMADLRL